MKVTEGDVQYVADLAHLDLTPEERNRMQRDLDAILGYIDHLNELDTSGVEPMAHVTAGPHADAGSLAGGPKANPSWRVDELRKSLDRQQDVMTNAPESDGNFFKVPKVIER